MTGTLFESPISCLDWDSGLKLSTGWSISPKSVCPFQMHDCKHPLWVKSLPYDEKSTHVEYWQLRNLCCNGVDDIIYYILNVYTYYFIFSSTFCHFLIQYVVNIHSGHVHIQLQILAQLNICMRPYTVLYYVMYKKFSASHFTELLCVLVNQLFKCTSPKWIYTLSEILGWNWCCEARRTSYLVVPYIFAMTAYVIYLSVWRCN